MKIGFSRRGQPLMVLLLILGGWVSARAMMWDGAAMPQVQTLAAPLALQTAMPPEDDRPQLARISVPRSWSLPADDGRLSGKVGVYLSGLPDRGDLGLVAPPMPQVAPLQPLQLAPAHPSSRIAPVTAGMAAGHQMLWMAALAGLPLPAELLARQPDSAVPMAFPPAGKEQGSGRQRWSADGWFLWRRGSETALAGGILTPSYGASQVGAVLRYRLVPDSARKPSLYLRTTAALNGSGEREAALGLSLRPFGRVPVVLAGEGRFTSTGNGGHMLRPAVYAVTELPPISLPLGLRGEAYLQGGYVGGAYATAFADGQLRVDRRLLRIGGAEMRLGGGLWGGAQKGASRLDAGPSLTLGKPLGGSASIRLGADWRFRVAGKAAPGSGPAVTLSAGF